MNYSKHVKKILLNGAESKVVRKGVAVQIFKFRLFVRDRNGVWMQITEDTKLANPVIMIYDAKKGGVLVQQKDSPLCEFTNAMLFWEDVIVLCNLVCFTKEEDKEEYNILKISANGIKVLKAFDQFLLWADDILLHSNLLETKEGAIRTMETGDLEMDAASICGGGQE